MPRRKFIALKMPTSEKKNVKSNMGNKSKLNPPKQNKGNKNWNRNNWSRIEKNKREIPM